MAHQDLQICSGDTIGVSIQGIPRPTNGVVNGNVPPRSSESRVKVVGPRIVCRLHGGDGGFARSGIGHTLQTDGHPAVKRQIGIDGKKEGVDAIGCGGSQGGIVKGGGGIDIGWIHCVSRDRGHKIVFVVHGDVIAGAAVAREVDDTQCPDEDTDVFINDFFFKTIVLGKGEGGA